MSFTCRFFNITLNFELNVVSNSLVSVSAEMCIKCRKYRLRGSFISKVIQVKDSNNTFHLGRSEDTAHLAVQFFPSLKFQNNKIFFTGSLISRTLIVWCFIDSGSELRTPWHARLEPGFGLRETKNNGTSQPPHRFRICRIQVGDLNKICTALLR